MSKVCQITGKSVMSGNNVSHSNRKTKRKYYPNLLKKTFFLESEQREITLKISTSALRTISKKGIDACVKEARAKGFLVD
jgi:large subunit ribosomal protein L28